MGGAGERRRRIGGEVKLSPKSEGPKTERRRNPKELLTKPNFFLFVL